MARRCGAPSTAPPKNRPFISSARLVLGQFAVDGKSNEITAVPKLLELLWRALPAEFGNWNSIWKRFWRLSQTGTFEAFFEALASLSETAHLVQMFDSTIVRAHVSAAGAKGGRTTRRLADRAAVSRRKSI